MISENELKPYLQGTYLSIAKRNELLVKLKIIRLKEIRAIGFDGVERTHNELIIRAGKGPEYMQTVSDIDKVLTQMRLRKAGNMGVEDKNTITANDVEF